MSEEKKIAHLGFIQDVINRMANNSFLIKGWVVTLLAAICALASDKFDKKLVLISIIPVVLFWILDGYYFYQEKLFRKLFEIVAANNGSTSINFEMNPRKMGVTDVSLFKTLFLPTLFVFYFLITVSVLTMFYFFVWTGN